MNILYVITGLGLGGAETQVCNLADEFTRQGHQVTIIYLFGDLVATPNEVDVTIIPLGLSHSILSLMKSFIKLVKLIKSIKPDIVHSHMVHANLLTRLARVFTTIPMLVSTAHSSNEGGKFRMLAYRYTDKLANITTNVGQESVNAFIKLKASPRNRILSMPNGINTERFKSNGFDKELTRNTFELNESQKLVIAVGRLDEAKDYSNMLNAITLLPTDLEYTLLIAGINVEKLQSQAEQLGISSRVRLLGLRKDIDKLMAAADVLLMSSEWEGLPIVIGEAMASECNIVTTDAGGCREWLTNNEKPVPVKNPQALAHALEHKLRLSNKELEQIGKTNRNHIVEQFSLVGIVAKWEDIYKGNY
jgi:glycosyltransferase involved in cell wall biosynthesis